MATRAQIRQALKQGIDAHFTLALNFKPSQFYPDDLPIAAIYFEDGETERDFDGNGHTDARLVVEITGSRQTDIDGYLDALAQPVEDYVKHNRELGGLIHFIGRSGFQYDRDEESFLGTLTLVFSVKYDDEE